MKIEVNNISLNYLREGEGNPLILLHGNGEDHHIFDPLVAELKKDFRVYAIDSRNHGESSQTKDFSYEAMAEDIFQLIKKEKLDNLSILGFSDGGIIALLLALNYGIDFRRMVLLGVNLKPTDFKDEIYQTIVEEFEKTGNPLIKMMLEQPNIELADLEKIESKTLLVAAENELYPSKLYEDMIQVMPNAQLKIMQGHDHGSYIINQSTLYPDLKLFLE